MWLISIFTAHKQWTSYYCMALMHPFFRFESTDILLYNKLGSNLGQKLFDQYGPLSDFDCVYQCKETGSQCVFMLDGTIEGVMYVTVRGHDCNATEIKACFEEIIRICTPTRLIVECPDERYGQQILYEGLAKHLSNWTLYDLVEFGDNHHAARYILLPDEDRTFYGVPCTMQAVSCFGTVKVISDVIHRVWVRHEPDYYEMEISPPVFNIVKAGQTRMSFDFALVATERICPWVAHVIPNINMSCVSIKLEDYKPSTETFTLDEKTKLRMCWGFRIGKIAVAPEYAHASSFYDDHRKTLQVCKYFEIKQHHCAHLIQRQWRVCMSDPNYHACKMRLMREIKEFNVN
jgi:hypothetical protein